VAVVAELLVKIGVDTAALESGLADAAKSIGKIGDSMTEIGGQLTAGLTAPLLAVGAAALATAIKVGSLADELLDLVDQTGLSTTTLQEFRHVALTAGVPADTLANAAIKLTTALQGSGEQTKQLSGAMTELGVTLTDSATGGLRSMDDLLPEIIAGLQGMEDTTARNTIAADIFGRSWADLAPVLSLGADGMEAARAEAHELGLVLSEEGIESADAFRKQWETLKAVLSASASQVGIALIPTLTQLANVATEHLVPALVKTVDFVGDLVDGWNNLTPATREFLTIAAGLAGAIGPILIVGGKLIALITALNPVVALAVVAFGSIVAAGVAITENWNVISFEAKRLAEAVGTQFMRLVDIFNRVKEGTEIVVGFFQDMFDEIVGHSIVPDLIEAVQGEFGRLDVVMAGAAQKAVATTNAAFANIVNPKALRAMDFNVTLDAEQLYAAVIRGGEEASRTFTALAFRTELATAVTADFTTNLGKNLETAQRLADQQRALEAAEKAAAEQALLMAQVVGLVPLPARNAAAAFQQVTADAARLHVEMPALTSAFETVTPTVSTFDRVLDGLSGVGSTVTSGLRSFGGGLLDVFLKFSPMGLAADTLSRVFKELEPAIKAVEPIVVVLAKALAAGLLPVLKLLFPVIKLIGVAFTFAGEVVYRVAQGFLLVIGNVVRTIGKLIDALPFVSGEGIIKAGENLLNSADAMGDAARAMGDARDELRDLEWPDEMTEAAEATAQQTEAAVVAIKEETGVLTSLLEVAREQLAVLISKDWSPVINVTTGGGSTATAAGSGSVQFMDTELDRLASQRLQLGIGDMSLAPR
jgi:hypothetical protein